MDIQLDRQDTTHASLRVRLEAADYQPTVDSKLKEYSRKAQMKGFRPGKVPLGLIRKMYGKAILAETVNEMLGQRVNEYLREQNLPLVGDPLPTTEQQAVDWETQREFEFNFDLGLVGDFDFQFDQLSLTRYEIAPEDSQIDEVIGEMQQRHGTSEQPDAYAEGDILLGTYPAPAEENADADDQETEATEAAADPEADAANDADDQEAEATPATRSVVLRPNQLAEGAAARFVGLEQDATVSFDPTEVIKPDVLREALDLSEEAAVPEQIDLTVISVTRHTPAPVDQALFDAVLGEGTVDSEEAFRDEIRQRLRQDLNREATRLLNYQLRQQLLANVEMELPNDFLRRWLLESNEQITEEQLDREFDQYLTELKWSLMLSRFAEQHEVQVSDEEVRAAAQAYVGNQLAQYGMGDQPELIAQFAENFLQRENGKEYGRIQQQVFQEKTMDKMRDTLELPVEAVSSGQFADIVEAATAQSTPETDEASQPEGA